MIVFNEYGYLDSPDPLELDYETFVRTFVVNDYRSEIFNEYRVMMGELRAKPIGKFFQWIDGSFVSKKMRPNDIDVVTFIEPGVYTQFEKEFRELGTKYPKVDLYFVKNYPVGHPQRFVTEFDQVEWRHLFSTDRLKRNKGFVQLNF